MSGKISAELLSRLLPRGINPLVFDSLPSTNAHLRELAALGAPEHTLVVAASQTSGRGRYNRTFFSPPGTGVYFSILLRLMPQDNTATLVTVAAALASAEACETVFSVSAEIKWVNDVLVGGRKAVGILAEAFSGGDFFVILGIGANIAPPPGGFPPELGGAGAFSDRAEPGSRERFVAETVTRLLGYLDSADMPSLLAPYRRRVKMTGSLVDVTRGSE
ncbi:MAG: biotin--[acetyl-CoA-carboxylase] ligase, partial [Clostridiales bacterium]|nr:biotin--[acetyl-CoA-carboxylase] ligase [Clostridiales bacterium]